MKNFEVEERREPEFTAVKNPKEGERKTHETARLGKRRKEKREKGGRERERGRGREKSGRHARAREGGPNNISKLMSCGAFQRGPVDSAPPFCIR